MRIVFLGSPEPVVTVLASLKQRSDQGDLDLVGAVAQPARPAGRGRTLTQPPVAQFAQAHGIPLLQPELARDKDFLQAFAAWQPDVAITAAYGQILPQEFLDIPSRATINIHPSLLPLYRGATPVQSAIADGCSMSGVTILFTERRMDAGNIILQRKFPIASDELAPDYLARMFRFGSEFLGEALELLQNPLFVGEPQDEDKVTHCRKIKKEDGRINWDMWSAVDIYNRYRAHIPWPGSYTFLHGKRIQIEDMEGAVDGTGHDESRGVGSVSYDKELKLLRVQAREGEVLIRSLKPEGKKAQDALAFWNGHGGGRQEMCFGQ